MSQFQPVKPLPIVATTCLQSDRYHCHQEPDAETYTHTLHCNDCHTFYETYDGPTIRRALAAAEAKR